VLPAQLALMQQRTRRGTHCASGTRAWEPDGRGAPSGGAMIGSPVSCKHQRRNPKSRHWLTYASAWACHCPRFFGASGSTSAQMAALPVVLVQKPTAMRSICCIPRSNHEPKLFLNWLADARWRVFRPKFGQRSPMRFAEDRPSGSWLRLLNICDLRDGWHSSADPALQLTVFRGTAQLNPPNFLLFGNFGNGACDW